MTTSFDSGFSNSSCVECEHDFAMILLRTVNETAVAYRGVNDTFAAYLQNGAKRLGTVLRRPDTETGEPWHAKLLLASASDAVNAKLTTAEEEQEIFSRLMNDSLTICQLSPFNTYWTLQALGNMGKKEQALWVIRHCYGGMIN